MSEWVADHKLSPTFKFLAKKDIYMAEQFDRLTIANIRLKYADGATLEELAAEFKRSKSHIGQIVANEVYFEKSYMEPSIRSALREFCKARLGGF